MTFPQRSLATRHLAARHCGGQPLGTETAAGGGMRPGAGAKKVVEFPTHAVLARCFPSITSAPQPLSSMLAMSGGDGGAEDKLTCGRCSKRNFQEEGTFE